MPISPPEREAAESERATEWASSIAEVVLAPSAFKRNCWTPAELAHSPSIPLGLGIPMHRNYPMVAGRVG